MSQISRSDDAPGASPPCPRLPSAVRVLAKDNEPLEQGLEGRERTLGAGRTLAGGSHPGERRCWRAEPPCPFPLALTACREPGAGRKGVYHPTSLSPSQPTSPYPGLRGRAPAGQLLACAGSNLQGAALQARAQSLGQPNPPLPARTQPCLGKLYIQRQTTHICFLTVGIAPTGTERTGSLLSPSPCD